MQLDAMLRALCDAGVEFVVIGGVAATLHGSAYVTFDLDICFSRNRENARKLVLALAPFKPRPRGFPPDLPFVWDEATIGNATVLTLQTTAGPIDLLSEVAGIGPFAEAHKHAVTAEAFGRAFDILDLPALIRAKQAAGRDKDLASVRELKSILDAREPS